MPNDAITPFTLILNRGGHFAAWEEPALPAKEIRDCFAEVR